MNLALSLCITGLDADAVTLQRRADEGVSEVFPCAQVLTSLMCALWCTTASPKQLRSARHPFKTLYLAACLCSISLEPVLIVRLPGLQHALLNRPQFLYPRTHRVDLHIFGF